MQKRTPSTEASQDEALRALASALAPLLRVELGLENAGVRQGWMTADDTGVPRAAKLACRRGLVRGAAKMARKWVFEIDAWAEFLETHGERPRAAQHPKCGEPEETALEELRRELGLVHLATETSAVRSNR